MLIALIISENSTNNESPHYAVFLTVPLLPLMSKRSPAPSSQTPSPLQQETCFPIHALNILIVPCLWYGVVFTIMVWPATAVLDRKAIDRCPLGEGKAIYTTVYQYSETNVMHFLFSLLRIKGLYMFQALLAHPQEAMLKWHLVYCVLGMSVGCTRLGVDLHPWCSQRT
jgi:hypothetical protein